MVNSRDSKRNLWILAGCIFFILLVTYPEQHQQPPNKEGEREEELTSVKVKPQYQLCTDGDENKRFDCYDAEVTLSKSMLRVVVSEEAGRKLEHLGLAMWGSFQARSTDGKAYNDRAEWTFQTDENIYSGCLKDVVCSNDKKVLCAGRVLGTKETWKYKGLDYRFMVIRKTPTTS